MALEGLRTTSTFLADLSSVPIIMRASFIVTTTMGIILLVVGGLMHTGVIRLPASTHMTRKMVSTADELGAVLDAAKLFGAKYSQSAAGIAALNFTQLEQVGHQHEALS